MGYRYKLIKAIKRLAKTHHHETDNIRLNVKILSCKNI